MTNGSTVSWLWFFLVGEIPFWRVRRPLAAPGRARRRSVEAVQEKLHFGDKDIGMYLESSYLSSAGPVLEILCRHLH